MDINIDRRIAKTKNANGETINLIQSSFLPVINYFKENH